MCAILNLTHLALALPFFTANRFSCRVILIQELFFQVSTALLKEKENKWKRVKPQFKLMTSLLLQRPRDKGPRVLTENVCGNPRKHGAHLIIIFRLVMTQKLVSS